MRKTCCGILLVLIVFLLFLPSLLSTKLGTQLLISSLEKKFTKKIQVSKLHLSWLGKQKILQLEITDHNQPWFTSSQITIDGSLISLVLFHKLKKLEIADPKLAWEEKMPIPLSQNHKKPKDPLLGVFAIAEILEVINGSLVFSDIQFDNIDLKWNQDLGDLFLQADSLQNQIRGFVKLQSHFLFSKKIKPFFTPLTLAITCTNLSTELLNLFTQDSSVRSLIGDVFDLQLDASLKEQLYTFHLSSPLLKMQGTAHWDKEQLLASSIPFSFTLTQDNYALIGPLIKLPVLTLVEPSVFQGTINQLSLNTKGFLPILNSSSLSCSAIMTNEKLILASKDEVSRISSLQIKIDASKNLLSSQIQADVSAKKQGSFFLDISWAKQTEALHAEIRCLSMPTYLLEGLFPQVSLQKLCGPNIDLTLSTKLLARSGPISVEVFSSYSSFSLGGQLQKEAIRLDKPFYCQMNKAAGSYALQEIFPFLQPKNPISIKIAAGETIQFSYPLNSMHLIVPTLVVPTVEIEMGQVLCHNQSITSSLFNLLKIHQFESTLIFNLWVAPIVMHIDKGLITVERVELLLADLYEIAVWGKVKDNLVKMRVGLPASTLTKAFQIPNLPDDYVLSFKLEGSLENPQIDLKKAAAKIAALFICQQNKNPLNIFFPSCKGLQRTSVPPAKHPFPWEQTTAFVKDKNRKKFKQDDKPLKQLLKVIR